MSGFSSEMPERTEACGLCNLGGGSLFILCHILSTFNYKAAQMTITSISPSSGGQFMTATFVQPNTYGMPYQIAKSNTYWGRNAGENNSKERSRKPD